MKCPKCHYVSFDPEPRCRNCGYTLDFDPDLVITRDSEAANADLADLDLRREVTDASPPVSRLSGRDIDSDDDTFPAEATETPPPPTPPRPVVRDSPRQIPVTPRVEPKRSRTPTPAPPPRPKREAPPPTGELPLFVKPVPADPVEPAPDPADIVPSAPIESVQPVARVTPPIVRAEARPSVTAAHATPLPGPTDEPPDDDLPLELPIVTPPPLSVRRPAADALRPAESRAARVDLDLLHGLDEPGKRSRAPAVPSADRVDEPAGPARRAGAALVDAALVGAVTAVVLRLTLGWMDFGWADWPRLPLVPLAAFLLLIITGYLFVFTLASGQTPGKTLTGIRVVDAGAAAAPVTTPQALLRALVALPAVLVAGLGFLPALVGDERAVHDRVAHTRVVRA